MATDSTKYGVAITPVSDEKAEETTTAAERRREPRTRTRLTYATLREQGLFKSKNPRPVRVLDISPGGLGFESPVSYAVGSKLHLVIDTPVKVGIEATGEVRYSMRWTSSWRIGLKFTEISQADKRLLQRRTFLELLRQKGGRTA